MLTRRAAELGCMTVCLLLILALSRASPAETVAEHHSYLQTSGAETKPLDWQLLSGEQGRLKTRLGHEEDLTTVDRSLATRIWQLQDQNDGTEVRVERSGNILKIYGQLHGEPVDRQKNIDAAPWYQTLSLSLRGFLHEERKAIEFWTLRPRNLRVYKLRAVRKPTEEIEIFGNKVRATRVEIRLAGLGGVFW